MTDFSLIPSSPLSAELEMYPIYGDTLDYYEQDYNVTPYLIFTTDLTGLLSDIDLTDDSSWFYVTDSVLVVVNVIIILVCMFGLMGNRVVIWLPGFRMKRTPFTTYVLNLAVADFGVLTSIIPIALMCFLQSDTDSSFHSHLFMGSWLLFHFFFSISQFLLTIISVDRCMSVLFPIWYRCHWPERLSTILCILLWILCFLVHGICATLDILKSTARYVSRNSILARVFSVDAIVCLPLITISTLILFIRFCLKSQQHRRKKLLLAILVALFFFLFLAFPLNVMYLMILFPLPFLPFNVDFTDIILNVGYLCASLNSFVNPLIYFLVGRKNKGLFAENLKLILQRVFKQEEKVVCGEKLQPSAQTQVPA
ncbi:mas-related G-protein coupled receptor member D-like [Tiliqua scincoides]|uniref:mas-related G-protein coupled receptor member D-like n=1 Tax=Tiliqua scincoides TaxID=71010 RepID=UPI0034619941